MKAKKNQPQQPTATEPTISTSRRKKHALVAVVPDAAPPALVNTMSLREGGPLWSENEPGVWDIDTSDASVIANANGKRFSATVRGQQLKGDTGTVRWFGNLQAAMGSAEDELAAPSEAPKMRKLRIVKPKAAAPVATEKQKKVKAPKPVDDSGLTPGQKAVATKRALGILSLAGQKAAATRAAHRQAA